MLTNIDGTDYNMNQLVSRTFTHDEMPKGYEKMWDFVLCTEYRFSNGDVVKTREQGFYDKPKRTPYWESSM